MRYIILLKIFNILLYLFQSNSFLTRLNSINILTNNHLKLNMESDESMIKQLPIVLVVNVEIKEDRLDEFLKIIELDAIGSRTQENGGCLRFDVLRSKEINNKFTFYEAYINEDAVIFHKNTPHFKLWTDFKASGGVLSQTATKLDGIFYTY